MNGNVLAEHVVIADLEKGFFTLVLPVLRFSTQDYSLTKEIAAAQSSVGLDSCVRIQASPWANNDMVFHVAKRSDLNVIREDRAGMNERQWMNPWQRYFSLGASLNVSSAEAATSPSTVAIPEPLPTEFLIQ